MVIGPRVSWSALTGSPLSCAIQPPRSAILPAARRTFRWRFDGALVTSFLDRHQVAGPPGRERNRDRKDVRLGCGPHLGRDDHTNKAVIERRLRNHIAQLSAMGYRVTLEPAA